MDLNRTYRPPTQEDLEELWEDHIRVLSEPCDETLMHCPCVPHLRKEIARLQEEVRALLAELGVEFDDSNNEEG